MNDIVRGTDSKTRVLVASIASAGDVTALASQVGLKSSFMVRPREVKHLVHLCDTAFSKYQVFF